MPKKAHGMKRISKTCQRFLDLWQAGHRDTGVLARECEVGERQIFKWMVLLREGLLDRWMGIEHRVRPVKPGLATGLADQSTPDDPGAMDPPIHAKKLKIQAQARAKARKEEKHDDGDHGKAPTKEELTDLLNELYGPDFVPDPGENWDPMTIVRQAARDPRVKVSDRLKAAEICERRRQFDLLHGVSKQGKVNWRDLVLADIPVEEIPRVFGLLAEHMARQRAPFLGGPQTTPEQEAVYFSIGLQVHPEDAPAVLAELAPARAAAVSRAKALTEARMAPPADVTPVDPQDYLDHVPGGAN